MKIGIIMGRGIEGCGVTKFTLEQMKWLDTTDHEYKVFASKDKSWTRKTSHEVDAIHQLKFTDKAELKKMIDYCNDADMVIINSLPALSFKKEAVEGFIEALNSIKTFKKLIQHDHAMQSIRRNAGLDEAIKAANEIFVHSTTNDFAKYAGEMVGDKITVFGEEKGTPIRNFQPAMCFDSVRKLYWKDCNNPKLDVRHHKWIGRTTSWKGYKEMFLFHNEYLMKENFLTTFEGIERSPAFLGFRELSEFENLLAEDPDEYDLSDAYGKHVQCFGPYNNASMLERMGNVGFGYQLSILKPHFIQRSIEYTHCEVACTGAVPVFRKKYGERCIHRVHKKPLIECAGNGTVWFDEHNMDETINTIKELTKDPLQRYAWAENAYEFYRNHQDSQYVFEDILS